MIRIYMASTATILMIGELAIMGQIQVLDTCLGSTFLQIQAAIEVLDHPRLENSPRLEIARYRIDVATEKDAMFVLFVDKNERVDARENLGVQHGAKVKMNPDQVRILLDKLNQTKILDSIQGSSLLAIRAATPVFLQSYKAELADYKVEVLRDGESKVVIFADKDRKPGIRGHRAGRPGFEVELKPDDLKVLRSNFLR